VAEGKGTRRIVVREQKEIHKGTRNGRDYVIYQVIATTDTGVPIDQNLRSFQQLPKNQVIEVTVERFESAQWGVSYTLSTQKKGDAAVGKRIATLERTVEALSKRLEALENGASAAAPPPAAQPVASGPPAATSQQQPPDLPGGGAMPNDDIPF
jgi:hypothetical protein